MSFSDKETLDYRTRGGIRVERRLIRQPYEGAVEPLVDALERRRGVLLSSSFEYPGRYTRWDLGFVDPPVMLTARDRDVRIEALNLRGRVLVRAIAENLAELDALERFETAPGGSTAGSSPWRQAPSRKKTQPAALRLLGAARGLRLFSAPDDHTGLYGAFGYDLVFQFEPIAAAASAADDQRDSCCICRTRCWSSTICAPPRRSHYEFRAAGERDGRAGGSTARAPVQRRRRGRSRQRPRRRRIRRLGRAGARRLQARRPVRGRPGPGLRRDIGERPSTLFRRLRRANPAPYGALINLGEGEFLVAASPEMYVRVEGRRIETCPISGTIARGADADRATPPRSGRCSTRPRTRPN